MDVNIFNFCFVFVVMIFYDVDLLNWLVVVFVSVISIVVVDDV